MTPVQMTYVKDSNCKNRTKVPFPALGLRSPLHFCTSPPLQFSPIPSKTHDRLEWGGKEQKAPSADGRSLQRSEIPEPCQARGALWKGKEKWGRGEKIKERNTRKGAFSTHLSHNRPPIQLFPRKRVSGI